ncbi:GNAT family N-acetyltransferase [Salinactinospora qingdaonensis]|uniref:GNAT family N-acetyltransferase n=1 Tax=Salinactinospora qingdaonensis TaxID=702744 RepID=A0ABP7ETR8_9ACTN
MQRPPATLESADIRLRRWRQDEAEVVYRLVRESYDHLLPWMAWVRDYTRNDARSFIAATVVKWQTGEEFDFAVCVGAGPVGSIGVMMKGPDADHCPPPGGPRSGAEIGYWLHPAHTGHGIMTHAVAMLLEPTFALPGVEWVQIIHDRANAASEGVPRRLGFTQLTRHAPPQSPVTSGEVGEDVVWRITPAELRAGSPPGTSTGG